MNLTEFLDLYRGTNEQSSLMKQLLNSDLTIKQVIYLLETISFRNEHQVID